jgi:hypothetical protein
MCILLTKLFIFKIYKFRDQIKKFEQNNCKFLLDYLIIIIFIINVRIKKFIIKLFILLRIFLNINLI